jgi:hypothetical protein
MGIKIEHRTGVQASAEVIWDIVYDLKGWAAWNPLYPKAEGQIRIGEVLTLTVAVPNQPERVIRPKVIDWTPLELIHWKLSLAGGLVRSTRYIEIDALSGESCIFSNGEIFDGLLAPSVVPRMGRDIRRGFEAMGEAVKARAEAAWQSRKSKPRSRA